MRKVAVFLPISRREQAERLLNQVNELDTTDLEVELLLILDDKDLSFNDDFIDTWKYPFRIVYTDEFRASEYNVGQRRGRITKSFSLAKRYMPACDFVMGIEDDTDVPTDALQKLLKTFDAYSNPSIQVGVVSGVQVGRWGFRMIGAWRADNVDDPLILETVPFNKQGGIEAVDATGFYCFICLRELFVRAEFKFNDFGPDVNFGLDLRKLGYHNYIDWSIVAGHIVDKNITLIPNHECVVIKYVNLNGEWKLVPINKEPWQMK